MKIQLDGDVIKYRAAFAAERTEYLVSYVDEEYHEEGEIWAQNKKEADATASVLLAKGMLVSIEPKINLEPVSNALYNVTSIITGILDDLDCSTEDLVVHLSGGTNFRNEIATYKKYKGNRDKARRPTHGAACVEHMCKKYNCVVSVNEEADDTMGIAQWSMYDPDMAYCDNSVIVTVDKDLDMIPGLHYNFVTKAHYFVDETQAMEYFLYQMITGDTTDNIQGIPRMGKKRAELELKGKDIEEMVSIVETLYVQSYGEEEAPTAMLEMGQLLWIRREEDEIWNPQKCMHYME